MSKTGVHEAVKAAAEKVPGLNRAEVFAGLRIPMVGGWSNPSEMQRGMGASWLGSGRRDRLNVDR